MSILQRAFGRARDLALRSEPVYRLHSGARVAVLPPVLPANGVLQSPAEWESAVAELRRLNLPLHPDGPKNWDYLRALSAILHSTDCNARVLDAGGELYSPLLPALYRYGYRDLLAVNLAFPRPTRRGLIRYLPGTLTAIPFEPASFDAITCLSVIEHGVDLGEYFREMARLLKPGAPLISSTDYYPEPIDTRGKTAYGQPVHVFSRAEITAALAEAATRGLEPRERIELDGTAKPVHWQTVDLDYTFVSFALYKRQS
jgi:SAM-dependent methyltransferase